MIYNEHLNCDKLLMIQHHQMQTIFHARTHTVHTHASTFISVIISFLSQFALLSIILNVLFSFSACTPTETGRCKPACLDRDTEEEVWKWR